MNNENRWLLAKLAKVLGTHRQEEIIGKNDWDEILKTAKQHAVLSLLDPLLEDPSECKRLPENVQVCIREEAQKTVRQNYHLLYLERFIMCHLKKEGVDTVLLKGASTARYYPVPELRKSGDVDLFLKEPSCSLKAKKVMEQLGYKEKKVNSVNHHEVFTTPEHIEVELHMLLAEPFDDKRANQKMEDVRELLSKESVEVLLMGMMFPVLPDGMHAFYLLLHMLQHYLRAGFGLKLLCDWVVFWRYQGNEKEMVVYKKLIKESGLVGFSDMITSVCICFLGLEEDAVKSILDQKVDETECLEYMEEILESLEFGKLETEQMVALRDSSFQALMREFHHQMHLNFPKSGRCPLIWPVLWMQTGVRFIRNNRKVRKTTARQVITNARKRGKLVKKLHLFER